MPDLLAAERKAMVDAIEAANDAALDTRLAMKAVTRGTAHHPFVVLSEIMTCLGLEVVAIQTQDRYVLRGYQTDLLRKDEAGILAERRERMVEAYHDFRQHSIDMLVGLADQPITRSATSPGSARG